MTTFIILLQLCFGSHTCLVQQVTHRLWLIHRHLHSNSSWSNRTKSLPSKTPRKPFGKWKLNILNYTGPVCGRVWMKRVHFEVKVQYLMVLALVCTCVSACSSCNPLHIKSLSRPSCKPKDDLEAGKGFPPRMMMEGSITGPCSQARISIPLYLDTVYTYKYIYIHIREREREGSIYQLHILAITPSNLLSCLLLPSYLFDSKK